jgi:hypothetical protein
VPQAMSLIDDLCKPKDLALRFSHRFDAARLASDLARMDDSWWENHLSDYHDGNWQSISLFAPGGRRSNQFSIGGGFAATEALLRCDYVPEVIDSIPGRKSRIRFLRLRAGGEIFLHSDPLHHIDPALIRIHVPVQTNPSVAFYVRGVRLQMLPGETWFVDVRFKHSVRNAGDTDRVHLVIDVVANPEIRAMMDGADSVGQGLLSVYFLKHSLPKRLVRWLKIGN